MRLVKTEFSDDLLKIRPAQNLLADCIKPILHGRGDSWTNVRLGNPLRLYQDESRGTVEWCDRMAVYNGDGNSQHNWQREPPFTTPKDLHIVLQGEIPVFDLHFMIFHTHLFSLLAQQFVSCVFME